MNARAIRALVCCIGVLAGSSGCALMSFVRYKVAPNAPSDDVGQSATLPQLRESVLVTFDVQGVPHVEANSIIDLARAVGYLQARARFFQMDVVRRMARGRLSELVGEQPVGSGTTVDFDRTMRGWDIAGRAEADFSKLSAEDKAVLEAYADGVNAARSTRKPLEYRLLRLEPEPWVPQDSLAVGVLNVWTVTGNYQQELTRLLFAMHGGLERMEQLTPSDPERGALSIATSSSSVPLPLAVAPELAGMFPVALPTAFVTPGLGFPFGSSDGASNCWAVSGEFTQSGKPLVANDPHLTHTLPGIGFQQHLKAPGLDVIGMAVPGVPWVLSGHNAKVAWGMTATMADVIDLVIEQEEPSSPGFVKNEARDCALTSRDDIIRVRDGAELLDRKVTLRSTCNGPVLNDLMPALLPKGAPLVSVRWRVNDLHRALSALLKMGQASSVRDFGAAAGELPSTWNTWTAGDIEGHIGQFASGEVPVRPHHLGTFPVPGWSTRYEWKEFAKGERLPHAMDPPDGVLAHANNLMADPSASEFERTTTDSAPVFRYARIRELAAGVPKHDRESFRRMMTDTVSLRAKRLVPILVEVLREASGITEGERHALARLSAWNFEARADGPEAAIFFLTYRNAVLLAVSDELPPPAAKYFMSQRFSSNVADRWFEKESHLAWDDRSTQGVETRSAVLRKAFSQAVSQLSEQLGPEVAKWRWGALHWHRPMHLFGSKSILDGTVNLERFEASGEMDSLWKSSFDWSNEAAPFKAVAGPVYRSIVDLADVNHAWWVLDTGLSGWPASAHYGDQFEAWRRGEFVPMLFDVSEIRKGPHGTLTLVPER